MIRQYLALLLIGTLLLGLSSPALAGDMVTPNSSTPAKNTASAANVGITETESELPTFATRVPLQRFAASEAGDIVGTSFAPRSKNTVIAANLANIYSTAGMPTFATRAALPQFAAFDLPQSGQSSASQSSHSSVKHLTTGGKVMKWIGVGLMGEGALSVGLGAAVSDPCKNISSANTYCVSNSDINRGVYYGVGAVSIGVGALLFVIGIHKKE